MNKLTTEQKKMMRILFEGNGLVKDDVFTHKHYVIITRSGIEKIQYNNNIDVTFELCASSDQLAIVKAIGEMDGKRIESFGEFNSTHRKKDKQGNVLLNYPVALAEKRALSRVVLKLMNCYENNVLGEDEELINE